MPHLKKVRQKHSSFRDREKGRKSCSTLLRKEGRKEGSEGQRHSTGPLFKCLRTLQHGTRIGLRLNLTYVHFRRLRWHGTVPYCECPSYNAPSADRRPAVSQRGGGPAPPAPLVPSSEFLFVLAPSLPTAQITDSEYQCRIPQLPFQLLQLLGLSYFSFPSIPQPTAAVRTVVFSEFMPMPALWHGTAQYALVEISTPYTVSTELSLTVLVQ